MTPWSYGALYHPWVLVEGDHGLLRSPPEGAICGVMARRAVHRGAWIAPANEPLGDVLGLTPAIPREQWGRLLDAQVNLVRQEPHGFVVLSADTLAQDPELVQVNVRRLLVLLRRAALRLGPTFVFEPNNDIFRRSVERAFGALLQISREQAPSIAQESLLVEAEADLPPGGGLGCSAAMGVAIARAIDPSASVETIAARVMAWELQSLMTK